MAARLTLWLHDMARWCCWRRQVTVTRVTIATQCQWPVYYVQDAQGLATRFCADQYTEIALHTDAGAVILERVDALSADVVEPLVRRHLLAGTQVTLVGYCGDRLCSVHAAAVCALRRDLDALCAQHWPLQLVRWTRRHAMCTVGASALALLLVLALVR